MNDETTSLNELDKEKKKNALKRIMELEEHNYVQKEFSKNDMVEKIRKIIEEESK